MNLSALSIRYPRVLMVALLTALVWGSVALVLLPREEEPVLTWRLANVVARLPGASVERMESLVTDVLEEHVEEVDEVEHVYSVSRAGVSLLQIELSDEVTDAEPVWQKVRHKISQAATSLPPGIIGPELDDEIMGTFAQLIAVTGNSASYRQLKDHAQRLEEQLRYIPTTASTTLFGVQEEVVQVELDPAKLAVHDLSFPQVASAIRSRNTRRPSGRLRVDQAEMLVETSGEFRSDEELREMVLKVAPAGKTVRLSDVATIRRTTRTPHQPLAKVMWRPDSANGSTAVRQPAIVVGVRARADLRIDRVGERVDWVVEQFQATLPEGVECVPLHDLARYTRQRTSQLSRTLLLSIAAVFLTAAVFMGVRAASVVAATIPLTGLIVLVLFLALGIPLNQMSAMAIIMAFGLLIDDAIVITEQIHRRVREGTPLAQAAAEEPHRLSTPLVVTTLTTIAAFVPIYLLPGGVGEFVRAIPVGMTICLLTALVVSLTAVPWLCTWLLPGGGTDSPSDRRGRRMGHVFHALLEKALGRPVLTLMVVVAVMGALATLGLTLRRDFFSPVQRDQFIVDVFAPDGCSLSYTAEIVEQIERLLVEQEEIQDMASFVGRNAPLVFYNLESQETYANRFAQLVVRVDDWRNTARIARRVQNQLRGKVAGAECCVHILEHGAPFIAPFEIRISGPSLPTLHELGRRAAKHLGDSPGVRNVRTNCGRPAPKLIAEVNEPVARRINLDQGAVAESLQYRLDGLLAGHIREDDERIGILLRLPASDRQDVADLDSINLKPSASAPWIPFSAVASLRPEWEASSIYRRDRQRTLSVLAYPEFGLTSAEVSKQFSSWVTPLQSTVPPGYRIELGGENEQRHEAESNLAKNAVYAVFLILLLLVAEFRSFRLVAMILALIPLSLGGAMLGLFLTGWPLNFMAMMGMMILIGVVVNDALILVDGFEKRRAAGEQVADFVVPATMERARHVWITTATTIAGFLPLAISPSLLWPPLAIVVIGGLALATLVTLIAVPAAYLLLKR